MITCKILDLLKWMLVKEKQKFSRLKFVKQKVENTMKDTVKDDFELIIRNVTICPSE